jgi:hypothetical protein
MMLSDLADYLQTKGLGTPEEDIFITHIPGGNDIPDDLICLYKYQGRPPVLTSDGQRLKRPGLQVVVRGVDATAVEAVMASIEDALELVINMALNGTMYVSIEALGDSFGMGWENRRIKYAQNYSVTLAE